MEGAQYSALPPGPEQPIGTVLPLLTRRAAGRRILSIAEGVETRPSSPGPFA